MIIQPNNDGWAYDDSTGNWKLVYSGDQTVLFEQTDQSVATQSTLFVGTKEDCEAEIERLGLPFPQVQDLGPEPEFIPPPDSGPQFAACAAEPRNAEAWMARERCAGDTDP